MLFLEDCIEGRTPSNKLNFVSHQPPLSPSVLALIFTRGDSELGVVRDISGTKLDAHHINSSLLAFVSVIRD